MDWKFAATAVAASAPLHLWARLFCFYCLLLVTLLLLLLLVPCSVCPLPAVGLPGLLLLPLLLLLCARRRETP